MTKIVQITDSHLGPDSDYRLAGVNTLSSFKAVLDQVKKQEQFDLVMATGDIAAEADMGAYARFFELVAELGAPVICLPGNHDLIGTINNLPNSAPFVNFYDVGNWRIIMLNSVIEYSSSGRLGAKQLDSLRKLIAESTQPNVLISLHHQPVDVGCAWLDKQKISDADDFLQIVESDERVKGVFWGHVHQEFSESRNGLLFASAPSTCIQFKTNSDNFALDNLYPGYRVCELNDDGTIETKVKRVELEDYNVDINCSGY